MYFLIYMALTFSIRPVMIIISIYRYCRKKNGKDEQNKSMQKADKQGQ